MTGTIINYYFHCKRQCYMFAHRLNLEDNSEEVKIGKAIHEAKLINRENTEIKIDNISIDKISPQYVTELKKSDADVKAATWQLLFYLKSKNFSI
ncbi:Dna2/Cas4 domain-containing protein [Fusobacterium necrophorum]|uniref:Dna2/Cas4 domain-containing protein n=1 Tax=Fusobacterium necrophorum TaxID=859 RepID=UPI003FA01ADF